MGEGVCATSIRHLWCAPLVFHTTGVWRQGVRHFGLRVQGLWVRLESSGHECLAPKCLRN